MRSILDNKFNHFIKSNQALKLSKNPLIKLRVFIENEKNIKIEPAYVQKRLNDFQNLSLSQAEVAWLKTTNFFEKSFLTWISKWHLPNFNVIEEENGVAVEMEVTYSDAILAQKLLEACLSEARFAFFLQTTGEDEGRFYAFGSDRYNIKTGGFLNSSKIYIVEDAVGMRPNSDWYALVGIFLSASPFNFVGTTNAYHAMTLAQAVVTYCDDEKWIEDWPDSNFAPSEKTFDTKKFKGFILDSAEPSLAVEMRTKYPEAILVSPETSIFEIAHTTAHVGNIIFSLSQELVQDLNITKFNPVVSWEE